MKDVSQVCPSSAPSAESSVAVLELSKENILGLGEFYEVVFQNRQVRLGEKAKESLIETRSFVDFLLKGNVKVYGLTTGFGGLRDCVVSSTDASQLSRNIILSHDAGIGKALDDDVVLGAMLVRANSLAKGNSAFKLESLETLIGMINQRIIPLIPSTGSLGASGDLAFLARLGRCMCGDKVPVKYKGEFTTADKALEEAGILPFVPDSKEGLALTNGTSFMASMLAIAYLREIHELENILALQGVFLQAVGAVDAAFYECIQEVRGQTGQEFVAKILSASFKGSPFIDRKGVQNDYSTRCLPQIFGPKIESILSCYQAISRELDAITDNPLIFKDEEISSDVNPERVISFNDSKWVVISGGNFHGEYLATVADTICTANVKIALTMERQLTFLMNPARNEKKFPPYLIIDEQNAGLLSGFMITQYTANALVHKMSFLGQPVSIYNLTSSNEVEDVVSYGSTAGEKLLAQLDLMHQFNTIFSTVICQAYSISRQKQKVTLEGLCPEKIFELFQNANQNEFPIRSDMSFSETYHQSSKCLQTSKLREIIEFPLLDILGIKQNFLSRFSDLDTVYNSSSNGRFIF